MAEVIPQINIDGTKIKNTWTEKEYVTDEVYNALNKAVIDLKDNNNLLDSNSILFREEYNSSSKNLNNAIHQGVYSFTNSAVNAPSGVNGGNLFVTNTSKTNQGTSIITQIAFCHNGAVYARTKNNSENFTSWNKLAYITDNVASATKATQDSRGQQIDTTYVKGVTGSNATLTITKGNGTTSSITVNNVGNATEAGNINAGFENNKVNFPLSDFRVSVLNRSGKGYCVRPFFGKLPTNDYPSSAGVGFGAGDTHGFLQCGYDNHIAYIGGGNANRINWYKRIAFTDGTGAVGTWGINISGNASTATKATQDSAGQTINTTYVKGVTANNATLTITKGNGSTSTTTINNVSNSTNASNLVISRGTSAHIKYGGGDVDENAAISQNKVNLLIGSWFSTGFRDLCSDGKPIRVAINHRNGNIKTTGNVTASGAMYSATPGTSDNSTRVATTAFVHSLVDTKNDVYIGSGSIDVKGTYTIPLPSGYSRSQCRYAIWTRNHDYDDGGGLHEITSTVNQSTGVITGQTNRKGSIGVIELEYIVIAVK